jgi:hypothetical protein
MIYETPLGILIPQDFNGRVRQFALTEVDWQKSSVTFPNPAVLDVTNRSIQLLVTYDRVLK